MAKQACESYGFKLNEEVERIFTDYRKTHNQGVFDAYTDEMKLARKVGIITGLPDAYGRGRIIGDYRRVALYGVDFLIDEKKKDAAGTSRVMSEENIRLREELSEQIRALNELKALAKAMGLTFPSLRRMQEKHFNGCILPIWLPLKSKTEQQ